MVLGKKQDEIFLSWHLLVINILKSADLDNLHPNLKCLAETTSGPLMIILNRSWNTEALVSHQHPQRASGMPWVEVCRSLILKPGLSRPDLTGGLRRVESFSDLI